jgi:hypothetical protein
MNNPEHIFRELRKQFLGLKYFYSFMRIRDGKNSDPGYGREKIRIRDKHSGSATLVLWIRYGPGIQRFKFMLEIPEKIYVGSEAGSGSGCGSETIRKVGSGSENLVRIHNIACLRN